MDWQGSIRYQRILILMTLILSNFISLSKKKDLCQSRIQTSDFNTVTSKKHQDLIWRDSFSFLSIPSNQLHDKRQKNLFIKTNSCPEPHPASSN